MRYKARDNGPLAGLKLIDPNSHITEAEDLWTSRAPAAYRDRVPQTRTDGDGESYWCVDGDKKLSKNNSRAFVRKNGAKIPYYGAGMEAMGGCKEDIHAAAAEAEPRVDLLDEMGIYAQIVYPNAILGTEHRCPLYEVLCELEPASDIHIGARNWKIVQDNAANLYKIDV
jgi:hypothetical protein